MSKVMKSNCICRAAALLGATAVCLVSGIAHAANESKQKDIVDTAVAAGTFGTLVAAVEAADLVHTLKGPGPFTVLAPTDKAFERLPEGTLESLLKPENKDQLTAILTYHVVPGRVMARQVYGLQNAATVNGQRLNIAREDGKFSIGDSRIVATDIECTNGVIHVIDKVLLPELERIPAVAEKAGQFTTLLAAVAAAGLSDVLNDEGPFTVFAPTDDAFAKLPEGTVEGLLSDVPTLKNILLYHVVPGKVMAADVMNLDSAKTVQGQEVAISAESGNVKVGGANVTATDVECSNGVIHVIDAVLLPE